MHENKGMDNVSIICDGNVTDPKERLQLPEVEVFNARYTKLGRG